MNKKIPIIAGLVAAVIAGGWWFRSHTTAQTHELVYNGNVDLRQVSLAFNGSDRIRETMVQEGDQVAVGQVLAKLDTSTLLLQLTQAKAQVEVQKQVLLRLKSGNRPEEVAQVKANVTAAQAEADNAEQQFKRLQSVHASTDQNAVSQVELESAKARNRSAQAKLEASRKALTLSQIGPRREDIDSAQAQVEAAQAQYNLLAQRLSDAELKAPVAGRIRSRLMEVGDMASPQKPAFTIAILNPKWVRIYVPETDLAKVKPDAAAQVLIDSSTSSLTGKVGYVSSVAEFTPKSVQTQDLRTSLLYEVRVLVDDPSDVLRLGMPATVKLADAQAAQKQ